MDDRLAEPAGSTNVKGSAGIPFAQGVDHASLSQESVPVLYTIFYTLFSRWHLLAATFTELPSL